MQGGKILKKSIIHFVISALVGLGLGYLAFDVIAADEDKDTEIATVSEKTPESTAEEAEKDTETTEATATASGEESILQSKGCIGCHAVEGLNLQGGATGPDLSQAFTNVEGKHGKPLSEFLREPTSAVMSTVIAGSPLTDDEISQVVEELKKASEAQ
jgi:cytochrome c551/c552